MKRFLLWLKSFFLRLPKRQIVIKFTEMKFDGNGKTVVSAEIEQGNLYDIARWTRRTCKVTLEVKQEG